MDDHLSSVLSHSLENELPQTAAVALGWLDTEHASHVLIFLPANMRGQLLTRFCLLASEPDSAPLVRDQLIGPTGLPAFSFQAGLKKAVEILQDMDVLHRHEILAEVRSADPLIGERLGNALNDFDSVIPRLHGEELVRLVERADRDDVLTALRISNEAVRGRFLAAYPDEAAKELRSDLDYGGAIRMELVLEARERVAEIAAIILAEDPA